MGRVKDTVAIPAERRALIDRQHAMEGLSWEPWTRDRMYRLCHILQCQPDELAYRYFIPAAVMRRWLRENHIPPYVALHFVNLERALFAAAAPKKQLL